MCLDNRRKKESTGNKKPQEGKELEVGYSADRIHKSELKALKDRCEEGWIYKNELYLYK